MTFIPYSTSPVCRVDGTSTHYRPTNSTHAATCHCTQHLVINLSKDTGLHILMVCPHCCHDDFILGKLVGSLRLVGTHAKALLLTGQAVSV